MATLEGSNAAVAASSGHSARFMAIATFAQAGDNIVASVFLYGGTYYPFKTTLPRLDIEVRMLAVCISNPRYYVSSFAAFARVAHDAGVPLIA